MILVNFSWSYPGHNGTTRACSVSQALDRSKVGYLRQCGISTGDRRFLAEKSKLGAPRLKIDDPEIESEYRALWRIAKDSCLTAVEKRRFDEIYQIVHDERIL